MQTYSSKRGIKWTNDDNRIINNAIEGMPVPPDVNEVARNLGCESNGVLNVGDLIYWLLSTHDILIGAEFKGNHWIPYVIPSAGDSINLERHNMFDKFPAYVCAFKHALDNIEKFGKDGKASFN